MMVQNLTRLRSTVRHRRPTVDHRIADRWRPQNAVAESEVKELALTARKWRNELAHQKREYLPGITAIKAIRFVEHLNYAVLLRAVGYSDDEIKELLGNILAKEV